MKNWGIVLTVVIVALLGCLTGVGVWMLGPRAGTLLGQQVQDQPATAMSTSISAPVAKLPAVQPTQAPPTKAVVKVPTATSVPMQPAVQANGLVNPVLHHADSQPPENGVGSFDVGVHKDQVGLSFGWHIAWPKGNLDAGGGGCNLVLLTPGWYENLQVTDGRYEVYDVPSSDYPGWVKVLGNQRADEQAKDYKCSQKSFSDIPQWKSTIPSPP